MCKYVRKVGLFFRVVGYRAPSGINEKIYVHKCNYSPGQFTLYWLHKTWGIAMYIATGAQKIQALFL